MNSNPRNLLSGIYVTIDLNRHFKFPDHMSPLLPQPPFLWVRRLAEILAGASQNGINNSCFLCFDSEKYAFGVTSIYLAWVHRALSTSPASSQSSCVH